MEGEELNPLYAILESSSNFWLQPPPPLTTLDSFLSPQSCNISVSKNFNSITSPPPNEQPTSGKRSGREKMKLKEKETWYKGPWTSEEDRLLINLVNCIGLRKWALVAEHMTRRIGKQCRERWHNNLRPNIRKSLVWSDEEERMIIEGHLRFGNRWSEIAKCIPGRSENAVKNHWNSIKRRLTSKKRIKRPANVRNLYQSNVLENYIKTKFFSPPTTAVNDPPPPTVDAATSYLAVETVDEEMSFLRSLFGDNNGGN